MTDFIKIATKEELADGEMKLIEVDDQLVILFRIGDQFYCLDDVCTHDGGTLSDGELTGCEIECPRHGARFDVRTGEVVCMPATQATVCHETQVNGEDILVKLTQR